MTALDRVCFGDGQIQGENEVDPKILLTSYKIATLKVNIFFKEDMMNPCFKLQNYRPLALSVNRFQ